MSVKFDPAFLDTSHNEIRPTTNYHASLNAHGTYDGLRFVVRLSPVVYDQIAASPTGIGFHKGVSGDLIQGFSTYLHETIHWWQHVGSTTGFMLSLSFPAQTHANLNHLRTLLDDVGPLKSVRQFAERECGPSHPGTPLGRANIVINNQFDLNAYRMLATNPERAKGLINSNMFESVGHCYQIALGQGLNVLASTFDRNLSFVPNFMKWESEFQQLRNNR